jgi:hypothetical protein
MVVAEVLLPKPCLFATKMIVPSTQWCAGTNSANASLYTISMLRNHWRGCARSSKYYRSCPQPV